MMMSSSDMAGLAGYSPFMMASPMVPGYASLGMGRGGLAAAVGSDAMGELARSNSSGPGAPSSPVRLPGSPLTPGVMLGASPFSNHSMGGGGANGNGNSGPSGPVNVPVHSPSPDTNFFSNAASYSNLFSQGSAAASAAAAAAAAASAYGIPNLGQTPNDAAAAAAQLPPSYFAAAAAAAASSSGAAAGSLPASLSGMLSHHHAAAMAAASAAAHHQQTLTSALSGALASGAMPPYLQSFRSAAALEAAAAYRNLEAMNSLAQQIEQRATLEQQLSAAAGSGLLAHNLSMPSLSAAFAAHAQAQQAASLLQQQLQAQQQAAAAAAALAAGGGVGSMPLAAAAQHHIGRLRTAHSADLSTLGGQYDPMLLMQQAQQQARPRWVGVRGVVCVRPSGVGPGQGGCEESGGMRVLHANSHVTHAIPSITHAMHCTTNANAAMQHACRVIAKAQSCPTPLHARFVCPYILDPPQLPPQLHHATLSATRQ